MKKKVLVLPVLMMMLAACGGSDSTPPSTNTSNPPDSVTTPAPPELDTIADARLAGIVLGSSDVSERVYAIEGTVTGIIGRSYHIQSGTDAIYVYHGAAATAMPDGLAVGKKVKVTGFIKNYNGLIQVALANKTDIIEEVLGAGEAITPLAITDLEAYKTANISSRLVTIAGLKYVSGSHTVGSSSRSNIKFSLGDNEMYAYVDKTIADTVETDLATKLAGFTTGTTIVTYTGNVAWDSTEKNSIDGRGMNIMPSSADNFAI